MKIIPAALLICAIIVGVTVGCGPKSVVNTTPSETAVKPAATANVVKVIAKQFEYSPAEITVKKGVPVTLEFTTSDVEHGFNCPELKINADIKPGAKADVTFTPEKVGRFSYFCDVKCGSGHRDMKGTIVVTE